MNIKLSIISLLALVSVFASGQSGTIYSLKDGVYEYTRKNGIDYEAIYDSLRNIDPNVVVFCDSETSLRRLIIKNDPSKIKSYYQISDSRNGNAFVAGTNGQYNVWLKKKSTDSYIGKNKNVKLKVTSINNDTIEVEILEGQIKSYYSGGIYRAEIIKLTPERRKLTYVRELTGDDEILLIMGPEELENKIEYAIKQAFIESFREHEQDSIYAFALSMRINRDDITFSSSVNTLEYIDGLIDNKEDLHFKYDVDEWRYETQGTDSLLNEISEICSDEMRKRRLDKKAILLFQKRLSETCLHALEKLKSERYFEQITGADMFLIYTISDINSDTDFNKRQMKKIVKRLIDNKYQKEFITWLNIREKEDN